MSSRYLYRIQPTREGFLTESTPEEDAIVSDHFHYLKELTAQGIVLLAGRTLTTDESSHGLVIFVANSDDAAKTIMEGDLAVIAGVFQAELFPFGIALAGEGILSP